MLDGGYNIYRTSYCELRSRDVGEIIIFCSSCEIGFYNTDKCPNCGVKTRKESRKNNGEKPRVNLHFEDCA